MMNKISLICHQYTITIIKSLVKKKKNKNSKNKIRNLENVIIRFV